MSDELIETIRGMVAVVENLVLRVEKLEDYAGRKDETLRVLEQLAETKNAREDSLQKQQELIAEILRRHSERIDFLEEAY